MKKSRTEGDVDAVGRGTLLTREGENSVAEE